MCENGLLPILVWTHLEMCRAASVFCRHERSHRFAILETSTASDYTALQCQSLSRELKNQTTYEVSPKDSPSASALSCLWHCSSSYL